MSWGLGEKSHMAFNRSFQCLSGTLTDNVTPTLPLVMQNHIPSSGNVETKHAVSAFCFMFIPCLTFQQVCKNCWGIYCIQGIAIREKGR